MREGIPGAKEEAHLAPILVVQREDRGAQCIVMPQRSDWDAF